VISIPLSRPPVDDEIRRAVLAAVDAGQYILGPQCEALERELAEDAGVAHAVLTSSGTAALWLILRSLGVKFVQEPIRAGPAMQAIFEDTCGNLIQIFQV
jgi:dTDP-4-amino-4,6-dideoxygalactose transaminase